jgi:hypothetical protein
MLLLLSLSVRFLLQHPVGSKQNQDSKFFPSLPFPSLPFFLPI